MLQRSLLILGLIGLSLSAAATHMSGGEIYWECVGNNQFRIKLVVYRDCAGINVDASYNLVLTSPCGNRNLTVTHNGGTEISQLCDVQLPNSTCNGGTLPGIQQYVYSGTITLPPCDSWSIRWTNIYRNNAIVNLMNPGQREMFIESVLNSAAAPCNDSPVFTNTAIPYVCLGYPVSYSYGAVDSEADSMSYSLIGARMLNGALIPYASGNSAASPIPGLTLDPGTGLLNFTLNVSGNWVVVVRVTEYDANGNVIGTIMRDMQFVAYPCSNIPPDAATGLSSNVTGAAVQTGPRSVEVCESGDFCFDMIISDANASNVLRAFSNVQQNLPGAIFTYTGSNPITARVCWNATPGTAGFYPFIVNVNDGACPIPAIQTYVYSITVLPGMAATLAVTNETCSGSGNGTITATVTAGTAPFNYNWNTGEGTASITGGAGAHTVVITDANGCISAPLTGTISTTGLPNSANAGPDLIGCQDALPVQLSASVTNATGGIWSGGSGTLTGGWATAQYTPSQEESINGAVELILTTTGNTSCPPATDTLLIQLPNSFLGQAISGTNVLCNGGATGTATFTPNDPGFTFEWDDALAQNTATATGLSAGTYTVQVTDALGCGTNMTIAISQPAPVSIASLTSTPEACTGTANGSATVTPTGGTAPYTYLWSNGAETSTILATTGTYTVTVNDDHGCTPATGQVTIGAQGLPNQANAGPDAVGCMSALPVQLDGSVVNATGGTWSGGTGTFGGNGLDRTYMPSVADVNAGGVHLVLTTTGNPTCPPVTDTVFIHLPNSFAGASVTGVNALCNAGHTGSATFSPDVVGFSYQWSDPAAQTSATATALGAGIYGVHVSDAFGCDTTLSVAIGEPASISIANILTTNEPCAGGNNGTATATAQGGTAPYSYTWSTGANGPVLTAGHGTYTLSVTDANGCVPAQGQTTIVATGQPNIANAGPDLIGCMNAYPIAVSGTVQNATGGTWSGGTGNISGSGTSILYTPSVAEVIAGGVDLVLTSTGNNTCTPAADTVHITLSNSFLNAHLTTTNVSCNGVHDGTIVMTPSSAGFSYLWNDASHQTTATATGLMAGTYNVTITDVLGCDTTLFASITEPATLAIATLMNTSVTCFGGNNGSAQLTISGGTPSYTIAWSTGQTGAAISGLTAGSYNAMVTDAHGCSVQRSTTITQPQPINITAQGPDSACVNTFVELTAQATGGSGGYVFNWNGLGFNDTIQVAFNAPQTVSVTVTDQAGCNGPVIQLPIQILDLSTATLTTYGDTTVCPGGSAMVGAALSGYPGSYSITWPGLGTTGNGPFTLPIIQNDNLQVIVTDVCNNTLTDVIALRLEVPPSIMLPPVIAEGCAPLTVQMPNLQLGNVMYHWNLGNGMTSTQAAPSLVYQTGTYSVSLTVTTPLGCTSTSPSSGQVIAYAMPTAAFSASPWITDYDNAVVQFTNTSTGTITNYAWTFGDGGTSSMTDPSHQFGEVGTFDVELWVQDNHGCEATMTHPVKITPVYDIDIPTAFTPNSNGGSGGNWITGDLSNDTFYPFVRFVDDFRMRVFNRWGELIFESNDLRIGWDGYYRDQMSPQDVYVVQTWFKFIDGKEIQKLTDLTLLR